MSPSRPLATILARSSRLALTPAKNIASRIAAPTASLHTARALADEEKRGFLSRLNPFAKPTQPSPSVSTPAPPAEDLNVEIEEEIAPIPSWKSDRQSLTTEQLDDMIRSAAAPFLDTASSQLNRIQLSDPKVLKACVVSTGQEIPNKDIASIHTLRDILTVIQRLDQEAQSVSSNPKGHVVAEWFLKNKNALPPNMVFIPYEKSKGIKAEDRKRTNKRFL
ncbi:hypothetical protein BGX28_003525 [Mortierella sp. GBA30]|nr:hypothetical protein BGX28_003525 [Mortierella sp. GBA30]